MHQITKFWWLVSRTRVPGWAQCQDGGWVVSEKQNWISGFPSQSSFLLGLLHIAIISIIIIMKLGCIHRSCYVMLCPKDLVPVTRAAQLGPRQGRSSLIYSQILDFQPYLGWMTSWHADRKAETCHMDFYFRMRWNPWKQTARAVVPCWGLFKGPCGWPTSLEVGPDPMTLGL